MFQTYQAAVLVFALFPTVASFVNQDKNQQKDPPFHFEGVVSSVDQSDPNAVSLTITVKEMRPTNREDVVTPVDMNYTFKVEPATKILGLDGTPEKKGLQSWPRGTKVKIETKDRRDKKAVEIRILPPG
jgi:hypothetical protein